MTLPAFAAEVSLYRPARRYVTTARRASAGQVVPMALQDCLDIFTTVAPFCEGDEACLCTLGHIAANCGGFPPPPCAV
jgi:hypothetical protein